MTSTIRVGSWTYEVNSVSLSKDQRTLIEVEAQRRRQRDGSSLWAVKRLSACLNTDGQWEIEPIPSSRDDAFIARCRYRSLDEAVSAYMKSETGNSASAGTSGSFRSEA